MFMYAIIPRMPSCCLYTLHSKSWVSQFKALPFDVHGPELHLGHESAVFSWIFTCLTKAPTTPYKTISGGILSLLTCKTDFIPKKVSYLYMFNFLGAWHVITRKIFSILKKVSFSILVLDWRLQNLRISFPAWARLPSWIYPISWCFCMNKILDSHGTISWMYIFCHSQKKYWPNTLFCHPSAMMCIS